jgi:hypothetical protein
MIMSNKNLMKNFYIINKKGQVEVLETMKTYCVVLHNLIQTINNRFKMKNLLYMIINLKRKILAKIRNSDKIFNFYNQ